MKCFPVAPWRRTVSSGSCVCYRKKQELSFKEPAAGLLPLIRGFLWMLLPWHPGHTICPGCTWEFIMVLTAMWIVTLNEIVEQYVRSDLQQASAGESERWESSWSNMQTSTLMSGHCWFNKGESRAALLGFYNNNIFTLRVWDFITELLSDFWAYLLLTQSSKLATCWNEDWWFLLR